MTETCELFADNFYSEEFTDADYSAYLAYFPDGARDEWHEELGDM